MKYRTHAFATAFALILVGCNLDDSPAGDDTTSTPLRVSGSNCAGVAPVMHADDGVARPAQSVLAHYYAVLDLYYLDTGDGKTGYQTDVPPSLENDVAYLTWQAKTVEIVGRKAQRGFAHKWFDGNYGILQGAVGATCGLVSPALYRLRALLAHTGLLQANQCGENTDKTPKFYEVGPMRLLFVGHIYDVGELVAAGVARRVVGTQTGPCLVPSANGCVFEYRSDAVTEAVVLGLVSDVVVAGVPVGHRAFTARGVEPLPNGLDAVREVLRSDQFAVASAHGQPDFAYVGAYLDQFFVLHHLVELVGHAGGPLETPNSLLQPGERGQVELAVGIYDAACCSVVCEAVPQDSEVTPVLAMVGEIGGEPPLPPGCERLCLPEEECVSGYFDDGLVVVVTDDTFYECAADCPHPSADAPSQGASCAL